MTEFSTEPENNAQVVVDTAMMAAEPTPLDPEGPRFYSQVVPKGAALQIIDLETHLEQFRDRPRRKKGTYTVHDVPSFAGYFEKHASPAAEVWADTINHGLVAVLNANDAFDNVDGAQWEDHRLTYAVKKTDAWKAWTGLDGKMVDQVAFAEHIEARSIDLEYPSASEMLEIAQTFQATTGVEFESGEMLSSGERKLTYKETTTARAGQMGHVEIPAQITLLLVPFEGAPAYRVTARFRYRISGGKLLLGFVLERPDDVVREAFLDVVTSVESEIGRNILRGVPQ